MPRLSSHSCKWGMTPTLHPTRYLFHHHKVACKNKRPNKTFQICLLHIENGLRIRLGRSQRYSHRASHSEGVLRSDDHHLLIIDERAVFDNMLSATQNHSQDVYNQRPLKPSETLVRSLVCLHSHNSPPKIHTHTHMQRHMHTLQ